VEYKIHNYRFENIAEKYYPIVKAALEELGHTEWCSTPDDLSDGWTSWPEINIYNHCHESELNTNNNIILKPTGPTSKHFALDRIGYANSSSLCFEYPYAIDHNVFDWNVDEFIKDKANKWDDSILVNWKNNLRKNWPKDHILVIVQQPKDETVNGFGFGNHWTKVCHIVNKLISHRLNYPVVVKLHPAFKDKSKLEQISKWKEAGVTVIEGYINIHDVLPRTRLAIIENSTAGIECLMHQIPIISYGFPEYHWVTKQLQSLTQLEDLVTDMTWHDPIKAKNFISWYIDWYLCSDIDSTVSRLKDLLYDGPN